MNLLLTSHAGVRDDMAVEPSQPGKVRCLGGCGREFNSPDRVRVRICPRCKGRRRDEYSPRVYRDRRDQDDGK